MPNLRETARELLKYFDSGNSVPVERATIRANAPEVIALRAALEAEADRVSVPIDCDRFACAPCYLCGYNGAGYYQPDTHPCATLFHAAEKETQP